MKRTVYIVLIGIILTACRNDEEWATVQTGFQISISDEAASVTRATPAELGTPAVENFQLKITNLSTDKVIYDDAYTDEVIPASEGSYTIVASCGDNPVLAWDSPYYEGSTSADVTGEGNTAVTIPCYVANALLSIKYANPDVFDAQYSEYGVKVSVAESSLQITPEDVENNRSVYFPAGSTVSMEFYATLKGSGQQVTKDLNELIAESDGQPTFAAGTHTTLTLSATAGTSGAILTIEKMEVTEASIAATLPLEWLPQPTTTGFGTTQSLTYTETEDAPAEAVITLAAYSAIQDVELTFDFEDEQYKDQYDGTASYLLSEMTDEQRTALAEIGITLPTLDGSATTATIDLTGFTATLLSDADQEEVVNRVKVNVKANNRWSSTTDAGEKGEGESYEIRVVKPKFSVSVYPGNIWTKEFTVNALMAEQVTSGNFEKLKSDMTYQFSTNGQDWTALGDDLRKDELTPGTKYYVKGVYRDKIESEPVEVTTYPIVELENGDMEDWTKEGPLNEYTYWYVSYPWVNDQPYWNTVNLTTTQDGGAGSRGGNNFLNAPYVWTTYVANSGTIPTNDSHSGQAALIRTVGWGSGSTGGGDASIIKNVTPGELYIGNYDISTHEPQYGTAFNSHPTAFSFWYKYEPKSTDLMIAKMVLSAEDNTVIGSVTLPNSNAGGNSNWTKQTLHINYASEYVNKEPATMYILFKSGSLTDTDIMDKPNWMNLSDGESVGSKLYIDDIELIYDK